MSDVARDPDVVSRLARAESERWHVIQPLSDQPIMSDWAEAESVIYDCQTDGEDLLRTIVFRAIRHGRELERQSLTKGENA